MSIQQYFYTDANNNGIPDAWESLGEKAKESVVQMYEDARDAAGYVVKESAAAGRDITKGAGDLLEGGGKGLEKVGEGAGQAAKGGGTLFGIAALIAGAAMVYAVVKK